MDRWVTVLPAERLEARCDRRGVDEWPCHEELSAEVAAFAQMGPPEPGRHAHLERVGDPALEVPEVPGDLLVVGEVVDMGA